MKPQRTVNSAAIAAHTGGMRAYFAQLGRAMFPHHDEGLQQKREHDWSVMHIDANGILRNVIVRVTAVHPGLRSLTVRRAGDGDGDGDGDEFILRVSKIVEAIDIRTGRRVNLTQWLADMQG